MSSSFFLKGKPKKTLKRKGEKVKKPKIQRKVPNLENGEESSESDLDLKKFSDKEDTDSDHETPEAKKLRLAKKYLEEIEKEEKKRAEYKELNDDTVANRLKQEYLQQQGKLRFQVADKYDCDATNVEQFRCRDHNLSLTCITLTSDGNYLFSGSKCCSIVKWSIKERKKVGVLKYKPGKLNGCINSIAVTSDMIYMATSDQSSDINIWDPVKMIHLNTFKGHKSTVIGLIFRRGFHDLYSASEDRSVKLWSLNEMAYIETLFGHQAPITSIDALTRERAITSGGRDSSIRIWKIVEESQLIYNGPQGSLDVVKLIDEEHFVSGSDNGSICLWSVLKKKYLCSVEKAHGSIEDVPRWIISLGALLNTDIFASGSYDGYIRIWKIEDSFKKINPLMSISVDGFVNSLQFDESGLCLYGGVGQEHRRGRWWRNKLAKNSIVCISFKFNK